MNAPGACVCDQPWTGDYCDVLQVEPVQFPNGYGMAPNRTTWGGGILVDDDNKYHLFAVHITNNCSLHYWKTNSRVDHAVSSNPTGPFEFQDVAIPTQAHNPTPIQLPDGTFAIVHIGEGDGEVNGGEDCNAKKTKKKNKKKRNIPQPQTKGSRIHISSSLSGPWRPLLHHSLGHCNNPAPFVHPKNGTIYIGCNNHQNVLYRADSIQGPYTQVPANIPRNDGRGNALEDPQYYFDHRGHFHGLFHAYHLTPNASHCEEAPVAAHASSQDGLEWHLSPTAPYTTRLELEGGTSQTLATRERPKPLVQKGRLTHLVNAVCGAPFCQSKTGCVDCKYRNWDFTLVLPLKGGN